jgi:lipoprotein-releasing system permease protein
LLSAFNGIETMIEKLYSEFDTDITISALDRKTFNENQIDYTKLKSVSGVKEYSRAVEEVVILKHEKKWVNANLLGVDPSFLKICNMSDHMIDGAPILESDSMQYAIIGATLLDQLDGFIPKNVGHESLICYVPKRDMKLRFGKNPFKTKVIQLSGRMNFNREVNAQSFLVPIKMSRELMEYKDQLTAIYVDCDNGADLSGIKQDISQLIGDAFVVKTHFEKNELIYKTSKSEKIIVLIILIFIFILAAFNLVASLTMLFVEKLDNIKTLVSFGANRKLIFNVFFYEGLLIAGKGIIFGAVFGYTVCISQIKLNLITMPNSGGEAFPMNISIWDGVLILSLVSALSILFSFLPVKHLIRKNIKTAV